MHAHTRPFCNGWRRPAPCLWPRVPHRPVGPACAQPSQRIALTEKVVSAAGLQPSKAAPPGKPGEKPPPGKPASVEVSKRFAVAVNMTFTGGLLPVGITAIGLPLSVDAVPPLHVEGVNFVGQVEALSAARAPTQCMYACMHYTHTHTHI